MPGRDVKCCHGDDDQNCQAEQREVTFHRVDGSTVVTTRDCAANGKVTGTASTTSLDGLQITSSRDKDGDGIVDQSTKRALVDNADGSTSSADLPDQ